MSATINRTTATTNTNTHDLARIALDAIYGITGGQIANMEEQHKFWKVISARAERELAYYARAKDIG